MSKIFSTHALCLTVASMVFCGQLSAQSAVNHPYNNGPVTVTVSTGSSINYYDSGGSAGSYNNSSNSNSVLTFVPTSASAKVQIDFSLFALESGYDNMYIYDGLNTSAPQIGANWTGSNAPNNVSANRVRATSASGALTIVFTSDGSVLGDWQALVTTFCSTNGVNNAGVISIDTFANFCAGTKPIYARIENQGTNKLNSVTVNWQYDGVAQTAVSWSTVVDTCGGTGANTATVLLGTKTFAVGELHTVKAWTSLPNGVADTQNAGDTLSKSVSAGLSGTYTIGGSSPSYATFGAAVAALTQSGVCGPITFNVRNGTYNEQISIGSILGVDSLKSIMFQSESGDSSLVNLVFGASSQVGNYTVQFNGADWVTFKGMTIEATGTTYGYAVYLLGGATHNTFRNCQIKGATTTSTSTSMSVVYMEGNTLNTHNRFLNNYIRNGSFGLYLYGSYNGGIYSPGLEVTQNRVENYYYMGCHAYYQVSPILEQNVFSTTSVYGNIYGIYARSCTQNTRIVRNSISHTGSTSGGYGMYMQCDGTALLPVVVANNFVYSSGSNTAYGMYIEYGSYMNVLYNTVRVLNSHVNSRALVNYYGEKTFANNLFVNTGGGSVIESYDGITAASNNNYYVHALQVGPFPAC